MNMDNFKPLQEWMDSIPEPKWWQFRTRFICWLSDRIDDHNTRKHERKLIKIVPKD